MHADNAGLFVHLVYRLSVVETFPLHEHGNEITEYSAYMSG